MLLSIKLQWTVSETASTLTAEGIIKVTTMSPAQREQTPHNLVLFYCVTHHKSQYTWLVKSPAALSNSLSPTNTSTAPHKVILFVWKELKFSFPNVVLKKSEASVCTTYMLQIDSFYNSRIKIEAVYLLRSIFSYSPKHFLFFKQR